MSIADELGKLEQLRASGALSEPEFAQAKAKILSGAASPAEAPLGQHLADQLAEVKYQNEQARIDREWQIESEQYLISARYGRRHVPTTGMGMIVAVVTGVFGVIWTILAVAITGAAPDIGAFAIAKIIFPAFGVLFTVAGIVFGMYCYRRAQKYQQAYQAYLARKENVRPEQLQ